jgi:hypothetical protein
VSQWISVPDPTETHRGQHLGRSPIRSVRPLIAGALALVVVVSSCSGDGASSWCDDARQLTSVVDSYRDQIEIPKADELRSQVSGALDIRSNVLRNADPSVRDAFDVIGTAVVDLDRVLDDFDFDLLRAQSESDSEQQDELFAVDGQPVAAALAVAANHLAEVCAVAP